MLVDAHVHASELWYEPVESLIFQMAQNDIGHAILVQVGGQYDNSYHRDCVQRFPDLFTSVVAVDLTQRNWLDQLRKEADLGAAGVRLKYDVGDRLSDPMSLWEEIARLDLAVSYIARPGVLLSPEFAEITASFPSLRIAVEHLGEARRANPGLTGDLMREVCQAIQPMEGVSLKIHGLGEGSQRRRPLVEPPFATKPEALLAALDVLGPGRLLWGSDYPPVSGREGYRNSFRFTKEALRERGLTDEGEAAVFGGNARKVFGIR